MKRISARKQGLGQSARSLAEGRAPDPVVASATKIENADESAHDHEESDAVSSQRLLYDSSTGNGYGFDSLLADFIAKRQRSHESSTTSLFRFAFDRHRSNDTALVHLGFLFVGPGNNFANRSTETSGRPRALSLCSQSDVCGSGVDIVG